MRGIVLSAAVVCTVWPAAARAQPMRPNEAGVTMGHLHLNTEDVGAARRLFTTLGGTALMVDDVHIVRFRGMDVYLHPQAPSGGSVGSAAHHVAFRVPSLRRATEQLE